MLGRAFRLWVVLAALLVVASVWLSSAPAYSSGSVAVAAASCPALEEDAPSEAPEGEGSDSEVEVENAPHWFPPQPFALAVRTAGAEYRVGVVRREFAGREPRAALFRPPEA